MRKFFKYIFRFLLIVLLIVLILPVLLYIPFIQNIVIQSALKIVSDKTEYHLTAQHLQLHFPLNLEIENLVAAEDTGDTIAHVGSLRTDISLRGLMKGNVLVKEVSVNDLHADLGDMLSSMQMQGVVDTFYIRDTHVDLKEKVVKVNQIALKNSDIDMSIFSENSDTVKAESQPIDWVIEVDTLQIQKSKYALSMPKTPLFLTAYVNNGEIKDGELRLATNEYLVAKLLLSGSSYSMQMDSIAKQVNGFNPMDMALSNIEIDADSIYNRILENRVDINKISFKEKSGIVVKDFSAYYKMDSTRMEAERLKLITNSSQIRGNAMVDMSLFDSIPKGEVSVYLNANVSKTDIGYFITPYLSSFSKDFPNEPLIAKVDVKGSTKRLNIKDISLSFPNIIDLDAKGIINTPLDIEKAKGEINFDADIQDLAYIETLMGDSVKPASFKIPNDIALAGKVIADNGVYNVASTIMRNDQKVVLDGLYALKEKNYSLNLTTSNFDIKDYLPTLPIEGLSASLVGKGRNFDPLKPDFSADLDLEVSKIRYQGKMLDSISMRAIMENSNYQISLSSKDKNIPVTLNAKGLVTQDSLSAALVTQLRGFNLQQLQVTQDPFKVSLGMNTTFSTDFKQIYLADIDITNVVFNQDGATSQLGSLRLNASTSSDDILLSLKNGDLTYNATVSSSIDTLLSQTNLFVDELNKQMKEYQFDFETLFAALPPMKMQLSGKNRNALVAYLATQNIGFSAIDLDFDNVASGDLLLKSQLENLTIDTLTIHRVNLDLQQKQQALNYAIEANKLDRNPKKDFDITMTGMIEGDQATARIKHVDGNNNSGLDLGLVVTTSPEGIKLHFNPQDPIILYEKLAINSDNYIEYAWDRKIGANFDLKGANNLLIALQSIDPITAPGPSHLRAVIHSFNLKAISNVLPSLPPFSGLFNTDLDIHLAPQEMAVKGDLSLDSLTYNSRLLGDLASTVDYESAINKGHHVEALMALNDKKILDLLFDYEPARSDSVNMNLQLIDLPLMLADPFIPDAMASLKGQVKGEVTAAGTINQPQLQGSIQFVDASVHVAYANAVYKFDDQVININNNRLIFDEYKLYAYNNNPIVLQGDVNFEKFDDIQADLSVTGTDVEFLNVKKEFGQMVYGRLMFDINTTVQGPINLLRIRGDLDLLSETRVNYVLMDSPLSAKDRVAELVTFTSFTDTTKYNLNLNEKPATLSGIDMLVTISIAPTALFGIDLAPKGDDRVELIGGGDLAFKLSPMGEMDLSGRYNLTGGFVNYSLPVLPVAKKFDIRNGSYVEWTGELMDPYINITAFEKIRASVSEDGKANRNVVFEPLIIIKNHLDNLQITFDVEVPEDLTIQDQLAQMTPEERSRQAMDLIILQRYSGPGTTAKVNSNSMLSSFIQKELNQFAGSMFKGVDLSVGIDTYDSNAGEGAGQRTDYSFRFSKSLFNERFRIIIGASVSSGDEVTKQDQQNFIDDIALEYMLDRGGTRFIKLFHHSGFESVLEGDIIETGIGVVLKRKVAKLRQLFHFRDKKKAKKKNENNPEN